jgi:hypothetical protein
MRLGGARACSIRSRQTVTGNRASSTSQRLCLLGGHAQLVLLAEGLRRQGRGLSLASNALTVSAGGRSPGAVLTLCYGVAVTLGGPALVAGAQDLLGLSHRHVLLQHCRMGAGNSASIRQCRHTTITEAQQPLAVAVQAGSSRQAAKQYLACPPRAVIGTPSSRCRRFRHARLIVVSRAIGLLSMGG